jgi:hypothetical protein
MSYDLQREKGLFFRFRCTLKSKSDRCPRGLGAMEASERLTGMGGISMSRTTLYRVSLVLILAAVLSLAPRPSWAGTGHHGRLPAPAQAQPATRLLGQAWDHLVSIFGRVGSIIDPNGNAASVSSSGSPTTVVAHHVD